MAISFSRPDPSQPASVAGANFPTARRGFDQQEVREFLRAVAAELLRMQDRERFLEHELRNMRQRPTTLPTELDDEAVARLLGEETTRIVQAAKESATAIRTKAEEAADRLMREARDESQRLREDAEVDAKRRRQDSDADADAELAMAKQQGREMVEEARAYRERALGELARRRDLARQQIDQLVHGRDRLVQAFERARLVAADVVAELSPLGELDEYVNLAPTTGPVPVMVHRSRLGDASAISDDALAARASADPTDPALDAETQSENETEAGAGAGAELDVEPDDPPAPVADQGETIVTMEVAGIAGSDDETDEPDEVADASGAAAAEAGSPDPGGESDDPGPESESAPTRAADSATVLHFPGGYRSGKIDDEIDDDDIDDDDDITATDVDDLFARIRHQHDDDDVVDDDGGEHPSPSDAHDPPSGDEPDDADANPAVTPFARRDEVLSPLITASARKLKRVLADEQNAVLDRLRRPAPVRALDDLDLGLDLVVDDAGPTYVDAIRAELLAAAEAGADSLDGATLDVGDDGVLAPVRESLLANLVGPLRTRLAERIEQGDGDNDAVTKSIRAVYREWKTKHIDDHLDHLLRLAYGGGAFAALPTGTPCRWIVDIDAGACSDCQDNSLQGTVPAGTAFPTGHVSAPAHAGCRCLLARADR